MVHLETICLAAANKADDKVSHFLRELVLLMKDCVKKHIGRARASDKKRRPTVVEILLAMENKLHDIVSDQSVLGDDSRDVGRVIPSRDLLLLPGSKLRAM